MDFFDSLFSIVPLLMLILFFVRIVTAAKKKKAPPLDKIAPLPPNKEEVEVTQAEPLKTAPQPKEPTPIIQRQIKTLHAMDHARPASDDAYSISTARRGGALKRMKSLPELKKAVIWAEVIGKPKGLE